MSNYFDHLLLLLLCTHFMCVISSIEVHIILDHCTNVQRTIMAIELYRGCRSVNCHSSQAANVNADRSIKAIFSCCSLPDDGLLYSCCSFMVALWNRADHYIFILWFLSSVFFFPRLISAVADWMSTILRHMVWP